MMHSYNGSQGVQRLNTRHLGVPRGGWNWRGYDEDETNWVMNHPMQVQVVLQQLSEGVRWVSRFHTQAGRHRYASTDYAHSRGCVRGDGHAGGMSNPARRRVVGAIAP